MVDVTSFRDDGEPVAPRADGQDDARSGGSDIHRDLTTPTDAELVEPEEVARLRGEGVALLDLRDASGYAAGHIDGAVSIPLKELLQKPSHSKGPVIVYDDDGSLVRRECMALREAIGPMEFYVLQGGLEAWRAAGLPVVA
jgi:rhodanese-related sulfurtransferase